MQQHSGSQDLTRFLAVTLRAFGLQPGFFLLERSVYFK
jgi:hypothetical protein